MDGIDDRCVFGQGWTSGDKADSGGDKDDAEPAPRRKILMQPEAREQRDYYVAKRRSWQHIGQIGPGERGEVRGEEADEEDDSAGDPGIEDRTEELIDMAE